MKVTIPTWLESVLSRLSPGATETVLLLLLAGSTVVFLGSYISLLQTGYVVMLVGSILAAAMFGSAVRAFYNSGGSDPFVPTVCFVLLMSVVALIGGYACRDHSMRITLSVLGTLLLLGNAFYFIRGLQIRRRDSGAGAAAQTDVSQP
jgi:hypothetical protein